MEPFFCEILSEISNCHLDIPTLLITLLLVPLLVYVIGILRRNLKSWVSGLDLATDCPEVIVANCDQRPFLSLVINKILAEPNQNSPWAMALAEAALNSRLVAKSLHEQDPDSGPIRISIQRLPRKYRWNVLGITTDSLYTQLITLAFASFMVQPNDRKLGFPFPKTPVELAQKSIDHFFPRLCFLSGASPPGTLTWQRVIYNRLSIFFLILLVVLGSLLGLTILLLARPIRFSAPHGEPYRLALGVFFGLLVNVIMFRGDALRRFYSTSLNLSGSPLDERPLMAQMLAKEFPLDVSKLLPAQKVRKMDAYFYIFSLATKTTMSTNLFSSSPLDDTFRKELTQSDSKLRDASGCSSWS